LEEKMDEIELGEMISLGKPNKRAPSGQEMTTHHISIPKYLLEAIKEEAREKDKSVSLVASYLILAGLKAHVGTFSPPRDNTIKKNWLRKGRMWS
jgi:hypothetical protein